MRFILLVLMLSACRAEPQKTGNVTMTTVPDSGAAAERVELNMLGGPMLGEGVKENDTRLRVDLGSRVVFLEKHQPGSDSGGEAIGTFRAEAPEVLIGRLRAELGRLDLGALPAAQEGGLGITNLELRVHGAGGVRSVVWTVRDGALAEQLEGVQNVLEELMRLAFAHPMQAIELFVRTDPGLSLVVKNVGQEPVTFRNPRGLGAEQPGSEWALVRVAEWPVVPQGVTPNPPEWRSVGLAGAREHLPAYVTLGPGEESVAAAAEWTPRAGVRYLVQAGFSSYAGPVLVGGQLVLKGRLYSEAELVGP
jgi:hypothetical protein